MKFLPKGLLAALIIISTSATHAVDFTRNQAGRIAHSMALVLSKLHYRNAPLDDTISEKFLRNYEDALDYNHLIFMQSDIDDFDKKFGTKLDDMLGKDENPRKALVKVSWTRSSASSRFWVSQ